MKTNALYYGDCLNWMKEWPDKSVDLIYLDPPFNSKAKYNMLYSNEPGSAQYRAFDDTWAWDDAANTRYERISGAVGDELHQFATAMHKILGESGMLSYLLYMGERLIEMKRLLKDTGSIYLHCDPTASHYLKVLMDSVFGGSGFRNEIVWCYTGPGNIQRDFKRKHDVILRYAAGNEWTFNADAVRIPYSKAFMQRRQYSEGTRGIVADGVAEGRGAEAAEERYADGKVPETWWTDIPALTGGNESTGYPTQKPLALLDRIIKASSNEGDTVLDPFCGCGTTIEAANTLRRKWVGIDISSFAVELIKSKRLSNTEIETYGIPEDLESARIMAKEHPFQFESWAVSLIPGFAPNMKQVGDGGVDGRGKLLDKFDYPDTDLALVQVKGGGKFNINDVRAFARVIERDKAAMGVYVTLDKAPTDAAKKEAQKLGKVKRAGASQEYPRLQFWSVQEYFAEPRIMPNLPDMRDPYTGEKMKAQQDLTLFFKNGGGER